VAELARWQRIKNLVSENTLGDVWSRHIADSLQLSTLAPDAKTWLDLGSGAGFPGMVVAIALAEIPGAAVHLIESNARKCAFLRHAARTTGAKAQVHEGRIEELSPQFTGAIEVVTARALAPLSRLFRWTQPLIAGGAVGLFPKGREFQAELTEARKSWRFTVEMLPSQTDSHARILRIDDLRPLQQGPD